MHTFITGFLDTINVLGKQTFIDTNVSRHLRNIQLWKLTEYPANLVFKVWLYCFIEAGDMNIPTRFYSFFYLKLIHSLFFIRIFAVGNVIV